MVVETCKNLLKDPAHKVRDWVKVSVRVRIKVRVRGRVLRVKL
jgi:hypothetical protein